MLTDEVIVKMLNAYFCADQSHEGMRAAAEVLLPVVLAEATEEEKAMHNSARGGHVRQISWTDVDWYLAHRLARLTQKPDPAIEAVKGLLRNSLAHIFTTDLNDERVRQIVAAVDAARKEQQ